MSQVFLDTGYPVALEAADDQHHPVALRHWRGFSAALPPLVTTSYVFDMARLGIREALAFDVHFEQAGFRRLPVDRQT